MSSSFSKVAFKSDIPDGSAKVFTVHDTRIALCNVSGELFAIDDLCTHDNGPLGEGQLWGDQIECPRHGARFDVKTGQALCLPAVKPVNSYPVELRGEDVWVDVSIKVKK
jgi:3-phenylpropionate/trans-cinnamate dioxygenase ferredoxin subunit